MEQKGNLHDYSKCAPVSMKLQGEMTNLKNMGLASADRSNKATLLLTAPRSTQVVCMGFIPSKI